MTWLKPATKVTDQEKPKNKSTVKKSSYDLFTE